MELHHQAEGKRTEAQVVALISFQSLRLNLGLKRIYLRHFSRHGITSPVAVHSLPKTGTSSVEAGLAALRLHAPIYHTHHLNVRTIESREERIRRDPATFLNPADQLGSLGYERWVADQFGRWRGRPWHVVSMVRDPVARAISSFFEIVHIYMPDFFDRARRGDLDTRRITEMFLGGHTAGGYSHWFDEEIREPFDIDVYGTPFPKEAGHAIYRGAGSRLLVMRLESLEACCAGAFREFMGIPKFRPVTRNVGEEKYYADVYRRFIGGVTLPESYLDHHYRSRLARHFYTDGELARFKSRWMRRAIAATA